MAKHTKPVVRVHIGTIPEQYVELNQHLDALPVAARRWQLLDLATAGLQARQSIFIRPSPTSMAGGGSPERQAMDVDGFLDEWPKT